MSISGIYGWYCTASDKWYVGQTCNIRARKNQHVYAFRQEGNSPHLQHAWNLYGQERFEFHILEELQEELLDQAECWWIDWFQTLDECFGYNLDSGGKLYKRHSEETRRKISLANAGRVRSEETCRRISCANKGKKFSKETCRRMSESRIGRIFSEETRRKIAYSKLGHTVSEATRRKISESKIGVKRHPLSEEIRRKISEAHLGKRGRTCTESTRSKLSKSQLGRKHPEEQCRKLSESQKLRWAKIKIAQLDSLHDPVT